jgi:hypothetical protein
MGAESTKKDIRPNKFTKMAEGSERMMYCMLSIENEIF